MASCFKMWKRIKEETPLMKNGRILLEELIASCDGKCNPICTFSAKELKKATNNYDRGQIIFADGDYTLYKGFLEDRPISVKKYEFEGGTWEYFGSPFTDVVVGSQMSVHKNVLKLIGCCFETECPTIVYEYAGNETLSDRLCQTGVIQPKSLSWKCRIKIAVDIANALAYLHTSLSRPVVHRDIKPSKIILDADYVPRLTDFSHSLAIPEGETKVEVEKVIGTRGFIAPESALTGYFSDKSDVYSFGVVLLQLLIGKGQPIHSVAPGGFICRWSVKNYFETNRFEEILDPVIVAEVPSFGKEKKLDAFIALVLKCVHESSNDRPTMIDVGKELRQIYQYVVSP